MNHQKDFENESSDHSLENVERLIQQMSLKRPSASAASIADSYTNERRPFQFVRELGIALACLLSGILIGRISNAPEPLQTQTTNKSGSAVASYSTKNNEPDAIEHSQVQTPVDEETTDQKSKIQLIDEGLFLVNGKFPVRKFTSVSEETISILDPETGTPVSVTIPVRKTVVKASQGT